MSEMLEIRIHGRGGQGGKKLSKLIAQAAFMEGKWCQSFALYGAERRGAPVMSFVRIDDMPIELRGYITNPNVVIVLDDSLKDIATEGLKENGIYIINTENITISESDTIDVHCIDATKIAMDVMGKNIVNTTMIGAFAKTTGIITLENALQAIRMEFSKLPDKVIELNVECARRAYEEV